MHIVLVSMILIGFGAVGFGFAAWLTFSNQGVVSSGRGMSARLGSVSRRMTSRGADRRK